jgi:LuxR family transcriptional regulator, quorum-sensing system regulator BjaR1
MTGTQKSLEALHLLQEIDSYTSIEALEAAFSLVLKEAGVTDFQFLQVRSKQGEFSAAFRKRAADQTWANYYKDQNYLQIDPALTYSQVARRPVSWKELEPLAQSPIQKTMFQEAKEAVGAGLLVPIHDAQKLGVLLLSGREPDFGPESRPILRILSYGFLERAEDLSQDYKLLPPDDLDPDLPQSGDNNTSKLTARQIECLHWVGVGKTDWAIGEILGLSESTVHRHIERAKARLGVATRIQAVVAAQRAKLLVL